MYTGTNKTALKSQQRILDALLSLIHEEKYEDITIKNICKKANISRQRFYFLFDSKEEIVIYYLNQFFVELAQYINDKKIISLYDLIFSYFTAIDNNENIKNFMRINTIMPIFINVLLGFMDNIHILKTNKSMEQRDLYANLFLSSGLNSIFLYWIENDKEIPLNELTDIIENILRGNFFK